MRMALRAVWAALVASVALSALVFAKRLWKLASVDIKHCESSSRNKTDFAVATLCRLF